MKFMETRVVLVDPAGRRYQPTDLTFDAVEGSTWTSLRTFSKYPMKWDIRVPSLDIDIRIEAEVHDQEFITIICRHAYWEGRVKASGKMFGKPVGGLGYVERNGFQTLSVLSDFFKRVGAATRLAVEKAYPLKMSHDDAMTLVADKGLEYYLDGVPYDVVEKNLVGPVREICDRGGKSWRSYGALSCIDVVGGDCRRFARWLAMPEFMHVGSLIVDDIQDDSMTRRGGPCAHLVYGVPIAINAGTAAYFQAQKQLLVPGLTDSQLASLYDLYFQALRAGHAGQALDITGLDYLMDSALATGNAALAESRSLAIHRLKTAVPAGALARMGAVAGEGTKQQVEAVGRYFEGIGVAFQIMDDVLNLRGLRTTKADLRENVVLKVIGEDIMAGKVTMPVVKAISRLPKEEMGNLWDIIKSKPQEPEVVADCIQRLEDCGAVEACVEHAQSLVDDAWSVLDAAVPDSFAKIMLRAFGWFVIERAN
jgi:geranylgeranyl pyrophosphate synthase